MPAAEKYESPVRQLRRLAEDALREGIPFDDFWEHVIRPEQPLVTRHRLNPPTDCVIWPRDTFDRQNARAAIIGTREGWRRAYEGDPPTLPELAIQALGPALSGLGWADVAASTHEREPVAA